MENNIKHYNKIQKRFGFSALSLFVTLIALLVSNYVSAQFYSGSQMNFGKNRVQYNDFYWTYYGFDHYNVYFYEGGKELAQYVARSAKKNLKDIEQLFDYQIDNKLQFIVYLKESDYKQSNIGLSSGDQYNIGGVTKIAGAKIPLYFEGSHKKLDEQIRAGIAQVLINKMMFGGSLKNVLKNSTLLALPEWYTQGLVSYVSDKWNVDIDNRVRDGIASGRYKKFNHLTGKDAVYAGHSIWNYIANTYGESVISNILYMTKVSRNVESSFLFVLGVSMNNLTQGWLDYYNGQYAGKKDTTSTFSKEKPLLKRPKKSRVYFNLKMSPDGKYAVYATNQIGQYKVWLYDFKKHKAKKIMKAGHKIDRVLDYSYPLLAWHPSGKLFSIITESKGKIMLTTYTIATGKLQSRRIIHFQKILDFSYSDDGNKFVMSAVQHGQSDIYTFTVASNAYEQLTNDLYDDRYPRFIDHSKTIIFSSDRTNDTIKSEDSQYEAKHIQKDYDLFEYNYQTRSNVLKRITNTPNTNEIDPQSYDDAHICYLSDNNGVRNRYVASLDSVISYVDTIAHYRYVLRSFPVTNYNRNILEQDINPKAHKYAEIVYNDGRYRLYANDLKPIDKLPHYQLSNSSYVKLEKRQRAQAIQDSIRKSKDTIHIKLPQPVPEKAIPDTTTKHVAPSPKDTIIDINNYSFDTFDSSGLLNNNVQSNKKLTPPAASTSTTGGIGGSIQPDTLAGADSTHHPLVIPIIQNYHVSYSTDYVVTQLDNSFLNASYQRFTGGSNPIYLNPGFNGFFKIGMSDLMEDYRIDAGVRLSGNLTNNEYYLSYINRIHNLDKQLILHRQAYSASPSSPKTYTHEVKYKLTWPFSEVSSIRGTAGIRYDKTVYPAVDLQSLQQPNDNETSASAKLEYVFDNTISEGLNLYSGMRAKVFGEYYKQIQKDSTNMFVVGFDARYYQKVFRHIIWATRLAGSTSFGQQKLIYYMGGVDNWFIPKFDPNIHVATDQNYAYQTLATPMRGFDQNIRNGNTFVLMNTELRVPVYKLITNRPINSDFLNNLQLIGFTDIGTAWTGASPYGEDNSLNTTIISSQGNPLTITLKEQQNPIVEGYGFGVRSRVWGYFVRVDWAWGVIDGNVSKHKPYLSFSLDF